MNEGVFVGGYEWHFNCNMQTARKAAEALETGEKDYQKWLKSVIGKLCRFLNRRIVSTLTILTRLRNLFSLHPFTDSQSTLPLMTPRRC